MSAITRSRPFGGTCRLGLVSLAVVIMACGGGTGSQNLAPVPPTATATVTATPDPSALVPLNPSGSASQAGVTLHVVGLDADGLPNAPLPTLGVACTPALVFASPAPTALTAADVAQTRDYLQRVPETSDGYPFPSSSLPPPSTLRWVADGKECLARLEVTNNTGQDLILVSAGVRLLGVPVTNPYQYALVDLCNVRSSQLCLYPSVAPDNVYTAQMTLAPGGAEVSGPITVAQDSADPALYPPTLLLPSGATRAVDITILPPANTAPAIFRVVPELTVQQSAPRTLVFTSLPTTLVYGGTAQSSCYAVQGDQIVLDSQIAYAGGMHSVCL